MTDPAESRKPNRSGRRLRACLLISCVFLYPIAVRGEHASSASPLASGIDALVDSAVADGFAGGVAIWGDEGWLYSRVAGASDASGRTPVRGDTLFHVASITKYVTAALVLEASREGALGLDDSVDPLMPGAGLSGRGLTFEGLLAHRSGMGSSYAAERKADAADAVAAIGAVAWNAADAGSFKYSNDGYDLLAILLERVYGLPYEELVRTKLLTPAGIENAGFWGETDLTDPGRVGQPLRRVSRRLRRRNYGMIGSAGLLITARELVRFQLALKSGELLDETTLATLWAPRGPMSLGQATFGAFLLDHPALGSVLSARGYEDWGDNAILNDYLDVGVIVAIVTSKGPAEGEGEPFRSRIAAGIEELLAARR